MSNSASISAYVADANTNLDAARDNPEFAAGQGIRVLTAQAQAQLATVLVLVDLLEAVKRYGRNNVRTK